jgi:hypothetical protein
MSYHGIMKVLLILIIILSFMTLFSGCSNPGIDMSKTSCGLISIRHTGEEKIKIIISKDDVSYVYDLPGNDEYEGYPLQMGSGKYTVEIAEYMTGTTYRIITRKYLDVSIDDCNKVFLNSIQCIKWDDHTDAAIKASELTAGMNTEQKIRTLYEFIVNNIRYDYTGKLDSDYLPDTTSVLMQKCGSCYDFASLYAVMLRSIDIPTKLCLGTSKLNQGFHAWNEIRINGEWVIIDTACDSQYLSAGKLKPSDMIKSACDYNKTREY